MIIEYDQDGRIFHIVSDPVPPGLAELLTANGAAFLEIKPVPLPEIPMFEADGSPMVNDAGEQIMASAGVEYADVDLDADYVVDGQVQPRPLIEAAASKNTIAADDVDFAVITGLPNPTTGSSSITV